MAYIRVRGLSKSFNLDRKHHGKLIPGRRKHTVLNTLSFEIREGECVGIVGRNGSGKTTLLQLLAGILEPDEGVIETEGRILPLIELQTGTVGELTGRENIFMMGLVRGLLREEIEAKLNHIIDFSGLGDFIDTKFKNYSSGMQVRLAFSIAMEIPHDILLLDEVTAVGDEEFQKRSAAKLEELRFEGKTIVTVSHQVGELIQGCDRVIFLDDGKILADGPPDETIQYYLTHIGKHHLHILKDHINKKLKELGRLKPQTGRKQSDDKKTVGWPLSKLLRWRGEYKAGEAGYEDTMNELRSLVKEFEYWVNNRSTYLEKELLRLQELIYKQKEYNASLPPGLEAENVYPSELSQREDELRQMLEERQFLIRVKTRIGHAPSALIADRGALRGEMDCLLHGPRVSTDKEGIRKNYLEVLDCELGEDRPVEMLLPTIQEYSSICLDFLRSSSDAHARVQVLERFLNLIERKFKEGAQKELWVVERLLETTQEVFKTNVLLPAEGRFLLRYVCLGRQALLMVTQQSAARKWIEGLGHLLREAIHVVERELLNISLQQDTELPQESGKETRLREVKQQLLIGLSELYLTFRTNPSPAGKGWGFGDAEITAVSLHSHTGEEVQIFKTGDPMIILIRYVIRNSLKDGILVGLTIHHENGLPLFTSNTIISDKEKLEPGVEKMVQFTLNSLPLMPGCYPLSVAIYNPLVTQPYDHRHQALEFSVVAEENQKSQGLLDLDHSWEIEPKSTTDLELPLQGE